MELPPEINELVQKHLGKRALDVQYEHGRGAWIAVDVSGGQASFVPLDELESMFGGGQRDDFDQLLIEVHRFNPHTQVVILFYMKPDLQMIATVDIE